MTSTVVGNVSVIVAKSMLLVDLTTPIKKMVHDIAHLLLNLCELHVDVYFLTSV